MTRTAPEDAAPQVVRWPWQLSVAVGLMAFSAVPGLVIVVLLLIATVASADVLATALLLVGAALAGGFLLVTVRLYTRPTWPWWWAALACAVVPLALDLGDRLMHGGRLNWLRIALTPVMVLLLLAPASRRTVQAFSAAQARRATTSRNSQSIEPVPSDSETQA